MHGMLVFTKLFAAFEITATKTKDCCFTFAVLSKRVTSAIMAFTTIHILRTTFTSFYTPVKHKNKIYLLNVLIIDLKNIENNYFVS